MKPVDPTQRILPSHLVKRPDKKQKRRETVPGGQRNQRRKMPSGHKPGDDEHIVDELA